MSEEIKKAGSEGVDLSKYVPKEEHEKSSAMIKDLEAKLDDAKLATLNPEYLDFIESKKAGKVVNKVESHMDKLLANGDLSKLSNSQILALAVDKAKEAVAAELLPQYQNQLKAMGQTLSDVLAVLELSEVEKKYSDFNDMRETTKKILETSTTPLTIEQAYLLAKGQKGSTVSAASIPAGEKPNGGTPPGSMVPKNFKNKTDAAEDAWNSTVGAGKDWI